MMKLEMNKLEQDNRKWSAMSMQTKKLPIQIGKSCNNNNMKSLTFSTILASLMLVLVAQSHDYTRIFTGVNANRLLAESLSSLSRNPLDGNQNLGGQQASRAAGSQYLRRIQRSVMAGSENPLADLLLDAARKQEYNYRKQLNYQLSDLLAKADNDKALEKALLNALFQQQQQQQDIQSQQQQLQLVAEHPPSTANSHDLMKGDNLSYKQADLSNIAARLAAISDGAYVNTNDLASGDLGAPDYAIESGVQLPTNKRSMLPCNFNAVSCAKNPFRKF